MAAGNLYTRLFGELSRRSELVFGVVRIVSGILFLMHGLQKLFGILTTRATAAPFTQIWVGGVLELVCGALIALGLFARPAAFIASGTMAVAYTQFHWKLRFDEGFFPIVNGGAPALLYCLWFFYIACRGPGRLALKPQR